MHALAVIKQTCMLGLLTSRAGTTVLLAAGLGFALTTGRTGLKSNSGVTTVTPGPRSNSVRSGLSSTPFLSNLRRKWLKRVRPAVSVVAPMDQMREKMKRPSSSFVGSAGST
jgi:hypothetical protein